MKHTPSITVLLAVLFLASQLLGLAILYNGFLVATAPDGRPVMVYKETVIGPRPHIQGPETLGLLLLSVAAGTVFILLVVRFGRFELWKALFFAAAFLSIWIALAVVIDDLLALGIALLAAVLKVRGRNVIIHNLTEPFIYAGIAVILVPLMNVVWAFVMLAVISVYDFWAVFRSRHMVTMAKGLQRSTVFAGLSIPYRESGKIMGRFAGKCKERTKKTGAAGEGEERGGVTTAVLGGGDIAFPLLFTGTVMQSLILSGVSKFSAFLMSMALPAVLTAALLLMLWKASRGRFYPAMPVLSAGCLAGYLIVTGLAAL